MSHGTGKSGVRLLLILAVLLGVSSIAFDYHLDNRIAAARLSAAAVDRALDTVQSTLADFRTSQVGYVAAGQNPDVWMRQAGDQLQQIQAAFAGLQQLPVDVDVQGRVASAAGAFEALMGADTQARQSVNYDERMLATKAIFGDSADAARRSIAELSAARTAAASASDAYLARLAQIRLGANSASLVLVVLVGMIAVRLRKPMISEAASMAQMLRELPPPVRTPASAAANGNGAAQPPSASASPAAPAAAAATAATTSAPAPPAATAPASAATPSAARIAPPAPALSVNLPAAAELCTDLARVIDERDVPGLLARTARVLDARGIIIWMADSEARRLHPTLTHGYDQKVLARLGPLEAGADNVTSLAFRSRRLQQVAGSGAAAASAIAVPLITSAGCTGVLAAEVKTEKPPAEAVAVARIIAAQFATMIAPSAQADAPPLAAEA